MVFMLVKHSAETTKPDESEKLRSELRQLVQQEEQVKQAIASAKSLSEEERKFIASLQAEIAKVQQRLSTQEMSASDAEQKLARLKKAIEAMPLQKADVVEDKNVGEQNYLMGLRVEGRRIAVLLDASASMTDEKLLDIIRRKSGSDLDKKQGPKWQRTRNVARWLLARLPKDALFSVIAFNDQARGLGGGGWLSAKTSTQIQSVYRDIDGLVPSGPTNLEIGLQEIAKLSPAVSDLYVITDGLPTTGASRYAGLNPFSSCTSLIGKSTTISGECRAKLFRHTITKAAIPASVKINVVLLPIEGDPEAAPEFWQWTASHNGLLISPAENWP